MRFRLFRSRAFWFGLPGLVFLLWGWWVSTGHFSEAGFGGLHPWGIGQTEGEVFAFWDSDGGPDWGNFETVHGKVSAAAAPILRHALGSVDEMYQTVRIVFIPHYWLVLGYVVGWTGLVFWRSRKYRALPETK